MRRYQVFKRDSSWIVRDITEEVWLESYPHGRAEYEFRTWRSAMDMLYPAVTLALRERFNFDDWPEKLREFYQ